MDSKLQKPNKTKRLVMLDFGFRCLKTNDNQTQFLQWVIGT